MIRRFWRATALLPKLGISNVVRVLLYRALMRFGYYRYRLPAGKPYAGPFLEFAKSDQGISTVIENDAALLLAADQLLVGKLSYFSSSAYQVGFPPNWFSDPFSDLVCEANAMHWCDIQEFALNSGDIKSIWEPSRFDGLLLLARAWLVSRDGRYSQGIEAWISSWVAANPANIGPNWKCAQETGLRLIQMLVVSGLLQRWAGVCATPAMIRFVQEHAERIEPTMLYAVAQDNNHATSEAAALYLAGLWLQERGVAPAARWRALGRKWLENRIKRLVMPDGSFSQHSVNYHRLMLDTLCYVELARSEASDTAFSPAFLARCRAATEWLADFVDPLSGDAPNLGANDGARLMQLHSCSYRDFRPHVALAANLFLDARCYPTGEWDEPLHWLGRSVPSHTRVQRQSHLFADGGYVRLQRGVTWLLLRLPRYVFRPSQADGLHLDLWSSGRNLLQDAGSYAYHGDPSLIGYFPSTAAHNTVEFDGRDQMPRLGRFLFGCWLKCQNLTFDPRALKVSAAYRDDRGASHHRSIELLSERSLEVIDEIQGFSSTAILRWRLPAGAWRLQGRRLQGELASIEVVSDLPLTLALVSGMTSLHYHSFEELPVLQITTSVPGVVITKILIA